MRNKTKRLTTKLISLPNMCAGEKKLCESYFKLSLDYIMFEQNVRMRELRKENGIYMSGDNCSNSLNYNL